MNYQNNGQMPQVYQGNNNMSYNPYGQYNQTQMRYGAAPINQSQGGPMPYSTQPMPPQYAYQAAPSTTDMTVDWIQGGLNSARAYPKPAAGCAVILIDAENNIMFIKKTDPTGFPLPLRAFMLYDKPIEELEMQSNSHSSMPDMSNYLTKEDFGRMLEEYLGPMNKEKK